jgi:hypothetical protein
LDDFFSSFVAASVPVELLLFGVDPFDPPVDPVVVDPPVVDPLPSVDPPVVDPLPSVYQPVVV